MKFLDILNQRSSYYDYDNTEVIEPTVIKELINQATKAPSAYHLQNWYFIAVTMPESKEKLYQVAYQQAKIKTAPVTFIVCGDMDGYKRLPAALQPSIDAGHLPQAIADGYIDGANNSHPDDARLRRDESFRSASLASMVLMLAAEDKGFATGAMSGFEADKLQAAFELPRHLLPVMLITVGSPTTPRFTQKQRLPVSEKLTIL